MTEVPWADCRETHLSAVYLAGERVWKLKKPVRTEFVDLTAVETRERLCREEVQLNRRLSPDVYLGVGHLDLDGECREPAVVMRRLADGDRLSAHVAAAAPGLAGHLRDAAREIASFHARCTVDRDPVSPGSWAGVKAGWLRECAELDRLGDSAGGAEDRATIRRLGVRYLSGRQALFDSRLADGRVRDGHGDLRCDHVYLTADGIRILDCVEFDSRLRIADDLSDVAFLAMDLERLGGASAAQEFIDQYDEFVADAYPHSLLDFYVAYRAVVRAKVAGIRATQTAAPDGAARYVGLALAHLAATVPSVVLVGGLPGSGKTTLSDALATITGAVHISSDEIRHGLRPGDASRVDAEQWEAGDYRPDATAEVYRVLLDRADAALANGWSVVLDASWRDPAARTAAREHARRAGAALLELCCEVDEGIAYRRLARTRAGYSQAGSRTRSAMRVAFAPWPEARTLRTDGDVSEAAAQAAALAELAVSGCAAVAGDAQRAQS